MTVSISVIIPTLNESAQITDGIEQTRQVGDCEIIVVDGGSNDGTLAAAEQADQQLTSPPGRAKQQNMGAQASQADILLFLHADCRLPATAFADIKQALEDERVVGGCFRQRIDAPGWGYRAMEWGNNVRVHLLKWAYGDQAIFVRRQVFEELGGFPEVALMEDLYFMKKLKRYGRFRLVDSQLQISPRRWQKKGIIRQTLRNWTLIMLAHCGISLERLSRFYPHVR